MQIADHSHFDHIQLSFFFDTFLDIFFVVESFHYKEKPYRMS